MSTKFYDKKMLGTFEKLDEVSSQFSEAFAPVQATDGVKFNDTMFSVKTLDIDVTINEYDTTTDLNDLTKSRFGQANEVKAVDTDVEYDGTYGIENNLDHFTINDDFDAAAAEVLIEHGEAVLEKMNGVKGSKLETNAGETVTMTAADADNVRSLFNTASTKFINNKIKKSLRKIAYVRPTIQNLIVDLPEFTTAKNADVNISKNAVGSYKGFDVIVQPDEYFSEKTQVIFTVSNVGKPFIGIETARVIEAHNHTGIDVQSAGKYGVYVPEKNKKAIVLGSLKKA